MHALIRFAVRILMSLGLLTLVCWPGDRGSSLKALKKPAEATWSFCGPAGVTGAADLLLRRYGGGGGCAGGFSAGRVPCRGDQCAKESRSTGAEAARFQVLLATRRGPQGHQCSSSMCWAIASRSAVRAIDRRLRHLRQKIRVRMYVNTEHTRISLPVPASLWGSLQASSGSGAWYPRVWTFYTELTINRQWPHPVLAPRVVGGLPRLSIGSPGQGELVGAKALGSCQALIGSSETFVTLHVCEKPGVVRTRVRGIYQDTDTDGGW